MEKKQYDELFLKIALYVNKDVITASAEDKDDLGQWNDAWFTQNGN